MKALFYRKCENEKDYNNLSNKYVNFGQWLNFKIVKTIDLSEDDYKNFVEDFSLQQDYISKHIILMHMDKNDNVSCLLIRTKNTTGFLVYSAGYNYARYVAKYPHN